MALSDIDRRRDDAVPVLRRWDGGEIVCQAAGNGSLKIWDVRSKLSWSEIACLTLTWCENTCENTKRKCKISTGSFPMKNFLSFDLSILTFKEIFVNSSYFLFFF